MRVVPAIALLFAGSGCTEVNTDATTQADVVIEPFPTASCTHCIGDRVVGDPITVRTNYEGTCEDVFGEEYPCLQQPYGIEIVCSAPCRVEGGSGYGPAETHVHPLLPGPIRFTVKIHHGTETTTFVMPLFTAFVPDGIDVTCLAGEDPEPCTSGDNPRPVTLGFDLVHGNRVLSPTGEYVIASNEAGWWDTGWDTWHVDGAGHVVVDALYGQWTTTVDVDVMPELPRRSIERPPVRPFSAAVRPTP